MVTPLTIRLHSSWTFAFWENISTTTITAFTWSVVWKTWKYILPIILEQEYVMLQLQSFVSRSPNKKWPRTHVDQWCEGWDRSSSVHSRCSLRLLSTLKTHTGWPFRIKDFVIQQISTSIIILLRFQVNATGFRDILKKSRCLHAEFMNKLLQSTSSINK